MEQPTFSIILPFYNQQNYISDVLKEFQYNLQKTGDTYEIIAVNNGVNDLLEESNKKIISQNPLIVQINLRQSGWGRAVKAGIREAQGKFICYTNTARTDPKELIRLLKYAKISEDTIIKGIRIERTNTLRKWVSIFFNLEYKLVLKTPIWDVNATPKIIPKKILDQINLASNDNMIDAELMYKCLLKSIPIIEIPIKETKLKGWKSTTNFYSAIKMSLGILNIRIKTRYEK